MAVYMTGGGAAPKRGKRASDYAVGDIVKLRENGVPVEYLVVQQGTSGMMYYDASCDGTWVLRKDIAEDRQWNSTDVNDYAKSTINAYLNGDWLNRFDERTKAAIKTVKIPYRPGAGYDRLANNVSDGLSVIGFLLSADELNFNTSVQPAGEGNTLEYFTGCAENASDPRRIAEYAGKAATWWMRSPYCYYLGGSERVFTVEADGSAIADKASAIFGIRPAHILRADALFDGNNILKG